MNPNAIKEHLHESPFAPFQIITNAGTRYTINYREFIVPTRIALHLDTVGPDGLADSPPTKIAYTNITALEPLPRRAA